MFACFYICIIMLPISTPDFTRVEPDIYSPTDPTKTKLRDYITQILSANVAAISGVLNEIDSDQKTYKQLKDEKWKNSLKMLQHNIPNIIRDHIPEDLMVTGVIKNRKFSYKEIHDQLKEIVKSYKIALTPCLEEMPPHLRKKLDNIDDTTWVMSQPSISFDLDDFNISVLYADGSPGSHSKDKPLVTNGRQITCTPTTCQPTTCQPTDPNSYQVFLLAAPKHENVDAVRNQTKQLSSIDKQNPKKKSIYVLLTGEGDIFASGDPGQYLMSGQLNTANDIVFNFPIKDKDWFSSFFSFFSGLKLNRDKANNQSLKNLQNRVNGLFDKTEKDRCTKDRCTEAINKIKELIKGNRTSWFTDRSKNSHINALISFVANKIANREDSDTVFMMGCKSGDDRTLLQNIRNYAYVRFYQENKKLPDLGSSSDGEKLYAIERNIAFSMGSEIAPLRRGGAAKPKNCRGFEHLEFLSTLGGLGKLALCKMQPSKLIGKKENLWRGMKKLISPKKPPSPQFKAKAAAAIAAAGEATPPLGSSDDSSESSSRSTSPPPQPEAPTAPAAPAAPPAAATPWYAWCLRCSNNCRPRGARTSSAP